MTKEVNGTPEFWAALRLSIQVSALAYAQEHQPHLAPWLEGMARQSRETLEQGR